MRTTPTYIYSYSVSVRLGGLTCQSCPEIITLDRKYENYTDLTVATLDKIQYKRSSGFMKTAEFSNVSRHVHILYV